MGGKWQKKLTINREGNLREIMICVEGILRETMICVKTHSHYWRRIKNQKGEKVGVKNRRKIWRKNRVNERKEKKRKKNYTENKERKIEKRKK